MPTEKELEILNLIVESMFDRGWENVLAPYMDESRTFWYDWKLNNFDFVEQFDIRFYSGATKVCVASDFVDGWIIKFPLECEDFTGIELDNYAAAENRHLDRYFAKTLLLSETNGHVITIQEKVECGDDIGDSLDSRLVDMLKDEYGVTEDCDFNTLDNIYEDVNCMDSVERVERFFKDDALENFIEDFAINDLHTGNFGYRDNGDLVIIDFSGF